MTRPPAPAPSPMVGRERLLADLGEWLRPAAQGRGRGVLLLGEAGLGKSTVVEHVAATGAHDGFRVVRGWCSAAGLPPYWPWRRVLGGLDADVGFAVESGAPDDRAGMFAAVVDALDVASRGRPVLIVIEDIHWADPSSLVLLRTVVDAVPTLAVALVLTARDDPSESADDVRALVAGLPTAVRRVALPPLAPDAIADLVRGIAGDLPDPLLAATVARVGGNPFFASEVARLLVAHGADAGEVVPPGVREALQRRLARLSQPGHAVLTGAAIAGTGPTADQDAIDEDLVGAIVGSDRAAVAARLDEAARARLLVPAADGWCFAHALVREVLADDPSTMERRRLHRRVAELLAADPDAAPARLTHHWTRAGGGHADQVRHWAGRAATVARDTLAFEQAAGYLRLVLATPGGDRIDGLLRLGEVLRLAGDLTAARDAYVEAARLAEAADRTTELALAALGLGGGVAGFEVPIADEEHLDLLRRAEAALDPTDSPLRAALLGRRSLALTGFGAAQERQRLAEDAVAMAERTGDPAVTVATLAAYCDAVAGPDHVERRLASADRMLAVAPDPVSVLLARRLRLLAQLEMGELTAVDAEITAYQRAAGSAGIALYQWLPDLWRGMLALLRGDLAAASELVGRAEAIGRRAGSDNAAILGLTQRMEIHLIAGTAAAIAAETRDLVDRVAGLPLPVTYWAGMGRLLLAAGDQDLARAVLHRYTTTAPEEITRDAEWLEGHWALADLAVDLADHAAAVRLAAELAPYERLWAVDGIGAAVFGTVGHQLGRLAGLLGRDREAVERLRAARTAYERAGAPRLAAVATADLDRWGATVRTGTGSALGAGTGAGEVGRLRREGRFWQLSWGGRTSTVADAKGLRDLAVLLTRPGRPVAAAELVEAAGGPPVAAAGGGLGPALDATARQAYRQRLAELEDEIDEAAARADRGRLERLRDEQRMLAHELGAALGLGGRPRELGDPADRARKAVTMRIRAAIRAIAAQDEALGRHLRTAVRTGRVCVYEPDRPVVWRS